MKMAEQRLATKLECGDKAKNLELTRVQDEVTAKDDRIRVLPKKEPNSPRSLTRFRGGPRWRHLLASDSHRPLEIPEEDPGGKNTSVLAGGSLLISQQMKLPLYECRSLQAQREQDRVRMAERHMEELKATLREAGFCRSKIQRPLKRRIPPNIELDL